MMNINIDLNAETVATDYSWRFGLGADHAYQFHRNDVVKQLAYAQKELGFKQVRFHGIFNDDMFTYQSLRAIAPVPKRNTIRECNFRQVAHVLDNILSTGIKPFMELSFMPDELAAGNKSGLKYKNNICPPKNYKIWAEYLTMFIHFLFDRYGKTEVESWYFEVWNEPDLKIFFAGSQKDYFKLYRVTAETLKNIDRNLKVGGPSTSACKWIPEFISFCRTNNVPLDFVSTHHYPGDAFGNLITPSNYLGIAKTIVRNWKEHSSLGKTLTDMFYNPKAAASVPKGAVADMDNKLLEESGSLPTIITEWNSMAVFSVPVHDEKYSSAFILKTVLDLDSRFKGYMFWCLSDIFEEQLQLNSPFIGGYGIMTVDGIPKPNFWAFKMLSELYPTRLKCGCVRNSELEYASFIKDNSLQIIVFAQSNDPDEDKYYSYNISVNGEASDATVQTIDNTHCNPKAMWTELGCPPYLSEQQVSEICEKTELRSEQTEFVCRDGKTIISGSIRTNDAKLYTLTIKE